MYAGLRFVSYFSHGLGLGADAWSPLLLSAAPPYLCNKRITLPGGGRTGKGSKRGGPLTHPRNSSKTFPVAYKQHCTLGNCLGGDCVMVNCGRTMASTVFT